MSDLCAAWLDCKKQEKFFSDKRKGIEDELTKNQTKEANGYKIKVQITNSMKVDKEKVVTILKENDIPEYVFRWKPEVSKIDYDRLTDDQKLVIAPAITTTPSRPSYTIEENNNG
jgi:hypothetical protein